MLTFYLLGWHSYHRCAGPRESSYLWGDRDGLGEAMSSSEWVIRLVRISPDTSPGPWNTERIAEASTLILICQDHCIRGQSIEGLRLYLEIWIGFCWLNLTWKYESSEQYLRVCSFVGVDGAVLMLTTSYQLYLNY